MSEETLESLELQHELLDLRIALGGRSCEPFAYEVLRCLCDLATRDPGFPIDLPGLPEMTGRVPCPWEGKKP